MAPKTGINWLSLLALTGVAGAPLGSSPQVFLVLGAILALALSRASRRP